LKCNKGFSVNNGVCRPCLISCSDCHPQDINICRQCVDGLQLVNGKCINCPDKCLKCSKGKCGVCQKGYYPSKGVCVLNC